MELFRRIVAVDPFYGGSRFFCLLVNFFGEFERCFDRIFRRLFADGILLEQRGDSS